MKKLGFFLTINSLCLFSFSSFSQFSEISGRDLESKIYSNHQNGQPGYKGLYNKLVFKVEDFSILESNFDELNRSLLVKFNIEQFILGKDLQEVTVVYDKTLAKTDDFLKIFKEILQEKNVFLRDYKEFTLIRSAE